MNQLRALFSRHRPRYIRSLAYMLQATEYNVGDYLAWLRRTHDFSRVERRGHLVKTPKALVVELMGAVLQLSFLAASLSLLWLSPGRLTWALVVAGLLLTPYLTATLLPVPLLVFRALVQLPLEAMAASRTRARLEHHPGYRIGIAGSFGKTSMREILRTVLAEGREVAAPPSSYNTPAGIAKFVAGLTGREQVLVFELGEYYPGDIRRLSSLVRPALGVITGVNEAHLGKFKRIERTTATIFELADYLEKQPVYVNGDNALSAAAARPGHVLYSREGVGKWRVSNAVCGLEGTSFTLTRDKLRLHVESKLLGLHQIGPLSAAASIALGLGLTPDQVEAGLAKVKPFDHRLEPHTDAAGVITLDDSYNGNPDGAAAVIAFLGSLKGHRRYYVTPGLVEMGPRTAEVHDELGRQLAAAGIEKVVLMRNSVTPFIAHGLEKAGFSGELLWFDDGPAAFAALPQLTASGDVVLLQNDWPDQYA